MAHTLRKDERFASLNEAIASIEAFASQKQQRKVRVLKTGHANQTQNQTDASGSASATSSNNNSNDSNSNDIASSSTESTDETTSELLETRPLVETAGSNESTTTAADGNGQSVMMECVNAPECKWFVKLAMLPKDKKWKISSMSLVHHRIHCLGKTASDGGTSSSSSSSSAEASTANASANANTNANARVVTTAANANTNSVHVGTVFASWKDALASIRALAQRMGRRAVALKPAPMRIQQKDVMARRIVCQNHRNSNCGWSVAMEESTSFAETFVVIQMELLHSKECLETCNFSSRKRDPLLLGSATKQQPTATPNAVIPGAFSDPMAELSSSLNMNSMGGDATTSSSFAGATSGQLGLSTSLMPQNPSTAGLLMTDISKYQLTHEMRWGSGKDATKAISDFALLVQRKRAKLCKKNNGGSNKKYICSDEKCLWFVQLVKGWKSKNWKISAMNLKHSEDCQGQAKPTARQLAEMRFFRQAVITHSKSSGKLLTDNFLLNAEVGIKIPRGMAYRAQRMVVASSTDDLTESYKFIPSLLSSFLKKNPNSVISYEKDDQGHFVRAFLMPYAMAMSVHCMQQVFGIQVISFDTVSYHGCLVLLIGRDGNLKSQVIAFALIPNAEAEHFKWFLQLVKTANATLFEGVPVFCSHVQSGLLRALAQEARNSKVMFCVRNLIDEMNRDKNIPSLGSLEDLVWEMQSQETEEGFHRVLSQLESLNAPAAGFLKAINPKSWAYYLNRSVRLFKWASTGMEEAIQGSEILSSDEAPFDLLYSFLAFLMDVIFKKAQLGTKLVNENIPLTPGADAVYRQELAQSEMYTVRLCDEQVAFTWRTGARPKITHRVDLSLRTCTCGQMYQLGIPCRHYIAVALHYGAEANLMEGFDAIYKATTFAEVNRNLRIEIPAAEDLHKDESLLPAVSLKGARYKKRTRTAAELDDLRSNASIAAAAAAAVGMGVGVGGQPSGLDPSAVGMAGAKTPRLDFVSDNLGELV